jgi:hypothetical protein
MINFSRKYLVLSTLIEKCTENKNVLVTESGIEQIPEPDSDGLFKII